jgi:hypothetical protein
MICDRILGEKIIVVFLRPFGLNKRQTGIIGKDSVFPVRIYL